MSTRTLTEGDVRAVADALADALTARPSCKYTDAQGVATYLAVKVDWVYDHAGPLGAVRLGDGPKSRLRFDLDRVDEWVSAFNVGKRSEPADTAAATAPQVGRPRRYRARPGTPARLGGSDA